MLVERALKAGWKLILGHAKNEPVVNSVGNICNGKSRKTLKGESGELSVEKGLLGIWIAQTEGAKFRLQMVIELRNHNVKDIFRVPSHFTLFGLANFLIAKRLFTLDAQGVS